MPQLESSPRKMDFTPLEKLYMGNARVLQEIETVHDMDIFAEKNKLSLLEVYRMHRGLFELPKEPKRFREVPKVLVNKKMIDSNGNKDTTIQIISWPISIEMKGVSQRFTADGYSLGVKLKETGEIVVIQRSLQNQDCGGYLGTVAGYLVRPYIDFDTREIDKELTVKELLESNGDILASREFGLVKGEYSIEPKGELEVDYVADQGEYIGEMVIYLSKDQLLERARNNRKNQKGLAESKVMVASPGQIVDFVKNGELPTSTAHIFAISMAAGIDTAPIRNIPKHDPTKTFTQDISSMLL